MNYRTIIPDLKMILLSALSGTRLSQYDQTEKGLTRQIQASLKTYWLNLHFVKIS